MSERTNLLEEQANTLIRILCSSFYISHYANQELSIPDLAIDYKRLRGSFHQEMDEALFEFDGTSIEEVENPLFKKRLDRIDSKISDLLDQFMENAPEPIKRKASSDEELKYVEEDSVSVEENPIVEKWLKKFSYMGGNHCYQFEPDDLKNAKRELLDIAKYQIKIEAMEHVADEASLEGKYNFYKEFESVPNACMYFKRQLGEEYTRDLVKQKIKAHARIFENGDTLDDWSTINTRINSWAHHEKNKYK